VFVLTSECVYVCTCEFTYVRLYVSISMCLYMCLRMFLHNCVYMYLRIYVCTYVRTYTYLFICTGGRPTGQRDQGFDVFMRMLRRVSTPAHAPSTHSLLLSHFSPLNINFLFLVSSLILTICLFVHCLSECIILSIYYSVTVDS
jgi:hypothetical protein